MANGRNGAAYLWAHGVVASHPLRMGKALGSNPKVSNVINGDLGRARARTHIGRAGAHAPWTRVRARNMGARGRT